MPPRLSVERQSALKDAFRLYVEHHWTHKQFADHLSVSVNHAAKILKGQAWPEVPRPEGFQYPWPEQIDQSRLLPRAKVVEAFRRYQAEGWGMMDFVSYLGVSPATGYAIFRGDIYADIPRPEKLNKKTQRQKERRRAKDALWMMIRYHWDLQRIKGYLGCSEMVSVYRLLERKSFPDLFDELKAEGWDVQAYINEFLAPAMTHRKKPVKVI